MMQKFWEGRSTLFEAPRQGVAMTAIAPPGAEPAKTADQREDPRKGMAVGNQARDAERVATDARDAERVDTDVSQDARQGMGDLRKEYSALPDVQTYNRVVQQVDTALHTAPTVAGDQALLYSIAQMRDPMGSVGEEDAARIEGGVPFVQQQIQRLKTNLGSDGLFPAAYRDALRNEAIGRLNTANRAYSDLRNQYGAIARAAGYDPKLVVGSHAGAPYVARFREYDQANQIGEFSPEAIARAKARQAAADGRPERDEVQTGSDRPGVEPSEQAKERRGGRPGVGPVVLPTAKGVHAQPGVEVDGVTPKGQGYRPEPQLYHLGNTVADLVRQGKTAPEITAYLDEQYKPFRAYAGPPMEAFLAGLIRRHELRPSKPIKSLASAWDAFHMLPDSSETTALGEVMDSPFGAAALGVADTLTRGFGDEMVGLIYGEEANDLWDYSRQERPEAYMGGQLAGSLLLPTGAANAAREAGTTALRSGAGMVAARSAAARAGAARMGIEGGAYGTIHGFGAAEGDIEDRAAGAFTEGTLGYLSGRGTGLLGGKVAASGRANRAAGSEAADYAAAAERLGMEPYPPDMSPRVAAFTDKVAQTRAGIGPITRKASAFADGAKAARDRIARAVGAPMTGEGLGYQITEGIRKAIQLEHGKEKALIKAGERAAGDARIKPVDAFQTLSDEIDAMAETGLSETAGKIFKGLRDRMTAGPMTVQTLRDIRTDLLADLATFNVRGGTSGDRAQRVIAAVTKDIDTGLRGQGLDDAADLFRRADGHRDSYIALTDDVLTPLIGKDGTASGAQVTERMMADLQGNNARAVKLLNALPPDVQSIARASVIQAMGRPQNAAGDLFSFSDFAVHWDQMGETAKAAYFGRDARAVLNDLATVARNSKASGQWANHTISGGPNDFPIEKWLGYLLLGTSKVATNVTARMLTSQRMAKWILAATKKPNPRAQRAHIERLSSIAKAEPVIAHDILQLQSRLMEQFSGAAQRPPADAKAPADAEKEKSDPVKAKPAEGQRDDPQ